ncbi:hypothetical protein J7W19_13455 [Streptomyces mobaraensis NBRC 13819 = DSM 40847]|uniref:Uncharacterized protein n=1 Tax=Streptomyces mobaraensis (strain ATCC 29032 / DSM 40847 / JCM 4168 / NBRC 13819 / NCIMB 11159 / IPCR 16-22) TaxID=1223523 RepID=M2ZXL2_STRM1|nr:hypothetical protein [Streptomyces mobaraensis]EME97473.1 hypothetical protein H340_26359 [Streptomyces mobaraensis NBRC 13819 = DSM 40847]QTT74276.1 hypothetical protein J7W19_13455 [Streptomyces mobaraensis NBRC 13819 = DSM 40847]
MSRRVAGARGQAVLRKGGVGAHVLALVPLLPLLLIVFPACCALAAFGALPWPVPVVALPLAMAVLWLWRFLVLLGRRG